MKKVRFRELDIENKLTAVSQMLAYNRGNNQIRNYPSGVTWSNEDEVWDDLKQDWNPDEYFSFYLNDFNEVETKIG